MSYVKTGKNGYAIKKHSAGYNAQCTKWPQQENDLEIKVKVKWNHSNDLEQGQGHYYFLIDLEHGSEGQTKWLWGEWMKVHWAL